MKLFNTVLQIAIVAFIFCKQCVCESASNVTTQHKDIPQIQITELQNLTTGMPRQSFLVVFHAGTPTDWAAHLQETLPVYQFVITSFLDKVEAQINGIKTLPSVKFFGEQREDILVPKKQAQLDKWVELQLSPIARLDDESFLDFGNNDVYRVIRPILIVRSC